MNDNHKTTAELLDELAELRQEVARLKGVEAECIELKQQTASLPSMDIEESMVKRAAELEIVNRVSNAAATILESEKLLQEVVDLTKTSFDLYHAHIYLLDDTGDSLNLVAGAGDAGRQMVAEGWKIPFIREQSLVARAARTEQGVIVNDVRRAPNWLPNPLLPDTRSELAVPMIARGRVVGVLDVQADKVDYFTDEDIRIQTVLAAQVAVAVENARLFEQEHRVATELEEQARHLIGLNELSRELNQAANEDEVFKIAAHRMPQIIQADRASIALLTAMGNDFDILALEGEADVTSLGTKVPVEGTILGKAVRENYVIITADIRDSDFFEHRQLAQQGLCSTMNVPLMAGGRIIGVLNVASKKLDAYDIQDQNLMLQAVSLLSSAVENLRLLKQTQERADELEEVTTFLDSIFDNIPSMIFVKDVEELRFVRFNKAGEELIGVSREDMIGKNDYDFFSKEEADFFTTKDRETLAGGELVDIPEESIHTLHKGTRILHTMKAPIAGVDGKPRYLLGISEDITERKQAEEALRASEAQYRSLFARIIDPIFIYDAETNHFLDWNQSALARYGYTPEELQSMTPYQLHPHEELETVKRNIEDTEDTAPHQYTHITKKGEQFQVEISSTPLEYQGRQAYMSIARDITERKRAEAERERLLAEVEAAYRQYVRKEWEQFLNEQHQGRWLIEHQQFDVPNNPDSEALAPIKENVARRGTLKAVSGNGDDRHLAKATIVAPISLRGQVIGTLDLQDVDPNRQWTAEELGLVETVTEQLALTIENLRLFDDSQQRATREQLARKITDKMRASPDADSIIQTGLTELANALGVPRTYVKLISIPAENKETDGKE